MDEGKKLKVKSEGQELQKRKKNESENEKNIDKK